MTDSGALLTQIAERLEMASDEVEEDDEPEEAAPKAKAKIRAK
jgi:hypothetical protein